MIKDILSDIFSPYSSLGDRCLAAIMALLMLAAIALLGLLVFVLIDTVGIDPKGVTTTTVEKKQVVPPYTSFIMVGKVMVPQRHPESYRLHFKIEEEEVAPTVKKGFFDNIHVGDRIEVNYGFGRLSHSRQPKTISLIGR